MSRLSFFGFLSMLKDVEIKGTYIESMGDTYGATSG